MTTTLKAADLIESVAAALQYISVSCVVANPATMRCSPLKSAVCKPCAMRSDALTI
jgi:hypothetical protein